jgi:hypothetical protein
LTRRTTVLQKCGHATIHPSISLLKEKLQKMHNALINFDTILLSISAFSRLTIEKKNKPEKLFYGLSEP